MKDIYGDKITVEGLGEEVWLTVNDSSELEPKSAEALLTAKQARKLARRLWDAATEIDGKHDIGHYETIG